MGTAWSRDDEDDAQAAYLASWRPGRLDFLVVGLGYFCVGFLAGWLLVGLVVFVRFCLRAGGVL